MTALLIIGAVLASVGWLMNIAFLSSAGEKKWKGFIRLIGSSLLLISIIFLVLGVEIKTFRASLDGNNPYEKVYQYEKTDSGYIKTDSIYIKKD